MKATVVVSCYNQAKYINECLDSILCQDTDFQYDILISDDCSTDKTKDIITQYQLLYPEKITFIARDKNVGPAKNYIEAHKAATGDIIFHFDGDDVMLPGKLQKQFDLFMKDDQIHLVFHRALYFSDDGTYVSETRPTPNSDNGFMYFKAADLALWGTITAHSAYAYRKSSRKTPDPGREFMEWFFAMDSLLPSGKGAYIDEVLVKYRCNATGTAYLASKTGRIKAYTLYFNDLFYYFEQYPDLRKQLYSNCFITFLAMLKARCGFSKQTLLFLFKKCRYIRVFYLLETLKMRVAVAPLEKIR